MATSSRILFSAALFASIVLCNRLFLVEADETSLQRKLLENYNTNVRPPQPADRSSSGPVVVTFHMVFFGIMDLNPKLLIFTTNAQIIMQWKDPRLRWNRTEEGQAVNQLRFKPTQIWLPDVILYNCGTPNYDQNLYTTFVNVNYTGEVTYVISAWFLSGCSVDYGYFPFDEQHCPLIFTPLTMNSKTVKLVPKHPHADLSQYAKNGEFRLISLDVKNETFINPSFDEEYDVIVYVVEIQRRTLFYLLKYIYPSLLINALASMVFYIPCESGEKVTMGISAMLNMMVFLMAAANDLPSMTAYPYLSVYYCLSVAVLTLEVFMSCIGLKMFFRAGQNQVASDFAIAVALIMAKLSFTELRDPRGYFKERQEHMLARFFNRRQMKTTPRPTRLPSLSVSDIDDDMHGMKSSFREPPSPGGLDNKSNQLMVFNLMDRKYLGAPDESPRPRFAVRPRLSKSTDSSISGVSAKSFDTDLAGNPELSINVANPQLLDKVDKVLRILKKQEKTKEEEDQDELLKMEFEALSRVYDRFFLITSVVITGLVSCSIAWVSPHAMESGGI